MLPSAAPPHIDHFLRVVRREVRRFRVPAVGRVARRRDPFQVLISCLISLRTKDEVTAQASQRLFAVAKTPEALARQGIPAIEKLIYPAGFYKTKARTIRGVCRVLLERYAGRVPADLDALLEFKGVGRKTANLVITLGFGMPGICVDTHVHRISNRWGYVSTKTPEETEMALRGKLPRRHWITYNDLLVTFGQNVCVPVSPKCSQCPLNAGCPKVGVGKRR
ncbi:MAG: endonuclease III [Planctomycetes bacterium]|nr:endonuclease III [Planctomycetota bacterium]